MCWLRMCVPSWGCISSSAGVCTFSAQGCPVNYRAHVCSPVHQRERRGTSTQLMRALCLQCECRAARCIQNARQGQGCSGAHSVRMAASHADVVHTHSADPRKGHFALQRCACVVCVRVCACKGVV